MNFVYIRSHAHKLNSSICCYTSNRRNTYTCKRAYMKPRTPNTLKRGKNQKNEYK